jgi:hypothetical protein
MIPEYGFQLNFSHFQLRGRAEEFYATFYALILSNKQMERHDL